MQRDHRRPRGSGRRIDLPRPDALPAARAPPFGRNSGRGEFLDPPRTSSCDRRVSRAKSVQSRPSWSAPEASHRAPGRRARDHPPPIQAKLAVHRVADPRATPSPTALRHVVEGFDGNASSRARSADYDVNTPTPENRDRDAACTRTLRNRPNLRPRRRSNFTSFLHLRHQQRSWRPL
jgi:hypothetical protein